MARYRRAPLSREDSIASVATSVVVGAGAALVTYYLTRLLLSREPLPGRVATEVGSPSSPEALPAPARADASGG